VTVFEITGRAMGAQIVRLNAIASNLANAGTQSADKATAYRAMKPVFATSFDRARADRATVDVERMAVTTAEPTRRYEPGHPLADKDGYLWEAAVDPTEELVEMVETSRQYSNCVEVMQTAKTLMSQTLKLGR
jgi:flagellar basal-body rod protein FlgC